MEFGTYNFNYHWSFRLADAFPLREALRATADGEGRFFYENHYEMQGWEAVGAPHTYNDADLFTRRAQDGGGRQKRTFACYRKWMEPVEGLKDKKVFLAFEGIRQTCYLYVNGRMAGYLESGAAPFGFDITPYLLEDGRNLIAVATDSTSSRDMDFFSAETPNLPGAEPGSFWDSLTKREMIPPEHRGVSYTWNCNDFHPSVGGLSTNIRLYVKPRVYLTLPLYSNLRTKGIYVYGREYDVKNEKARICVEAEARNETLDSHRLSLRVTVLAADGAQTAGFRSKEAKAGPAADAGEHPLSVIPQGAYSRTETGFEPTGEAPEPRYDYAETALLRAEAQAEGLRFWHPQDPYLYRVRVELLCDGRPADAEEIVTGFRKVSYDGRRGLLLNDQRIWLTGYAQRAANEWAAIGCAPDWLKDTDAALIRESGANHIRFMHVAGSPADVRSYDRGGIVCTQPAGDKEHDASGRQWDQRLEAMRDVILAFRNHPSVIFWEAGNNSITARHMRQMRLLKEELDPCGGRYMGCRTINTEEVIREAEYVGTMLDRHAARFQSERMPVTETEYLREEAPRRVWDDFSPPDFDYDNRWLGRGGRKQPGGDCHDLTSEELSLCAARGYAEFFHDRIGGASGKDLYCAAAALCWTDSAQHGRQAYSENCRVSGRVDPVRVKKQSFRVFQVLQSSEPRVCILGHWNYPPQDGINYRYPKKEFDGVYWRKTGDYGFRDPRDKTVYVIGSYSVARVELFVNGKQAGCCEQPSDTFVFAFPHIDVTRSGWIEARAFDYDGRLAARDRIETAGEAQRVRLTLHTGPEGLAADGVDVAFVDVEMVDREGRVCPLEGSRISFELTGRARFLGGYNSGRFNGDGRSDSVIHQNYVYAECGCNRVFLRAAAEPGEIRLSARAEGGARGELVFSSRSVSRAALEPQPPAASGPRQKEAGAAPVYGWERIPEADRVKYVPEKVLHCKVLVDGQEPDTHSVLSVVDHGSVYSPVLYLLEALKAQRPGALSYAYDGGELTLRTGGRVISVKLGRTCLLADGEENLLNGQPYETGDGVFMAELGALISYIPGIKAWYDDKVNVYRIEWQEAER